MIQVKISLWKEDLVLEYYYNQLLRRGFKLMIYIKTLNRVINKLDNIAIIQDGDKVTYGELIALADNMSNFFQKSGVNRGDKVICLLKTSIETIVILLALNKMGAVFVPIPIEVTKKIFDKYVTLISPKMVIGYDNNEVIFAKDTQYCINYINYRDKILVNKIVYNEQVLIKKISTSTFEEQKLSKMYQNKNDVAEILFTSGSTGEPKGIVLTNDNICCNVEGIIAYTDLSYNDKVLIIKNICHSSTINGEIITSLFAGATIVTSKKLVTPKLMSRYIEKYNISVLFLIPTILIKLIEFVKSQNKKMNSIRLINFYGSTISKNNIKKCIDVFNGVKIIYSYGLTEASPRVTYMDINKNVKKIGSSGIPIKGTKITIRNKKTASICKKNEIGEIYVQGRNVMKEYYNNIELTNKVITKYGLKTGDIGYLDKDNYLYVLGRKDDMIIRAGSNIYPAEIENIIAQCEYVSQVLVYGEKKESDIGTKIVASIELKEKFIHEDNIKSKIYKYCIRNMEKSKVPDVIEISEKLDVTFTGKLRRKKY